MYKDEKSVGRPCENWMRRVDCSAKGRRAVWPRESRLPTDGLELLNWTEREGSASVRQRGREREGARADALCCGRADGRTDGRTDAFRARSTQVTSCCTLRPTRHSLHQPCPTITTSLLPSNSHRGHLSRPVASSHRRIVAALGAVVSSHPSTCTTTTASMSIISNVSLLTVTAAPPTPAPAPAAT